MLVRKLPNVSPSFLRLIEKKSTRADDGSALYELKKSGLGQYPALNDAKGGCQQQDSGCSYGMIDGCRPPLKLEAAMSALALGGSIDSWRNAINNGKMPSYLFRSRSGTSR